MTRRDYQPGRGPVRGIIHALLLGILFWVALAVLIVAIVS